MREITMHITAENINYRCNNTGENIKYKKQQKKQKIFQEFYSNSLGFRVVSFKEEVFYLNEAKTYPRPTSLMIPNVPVKMRAMSEDITLGITNLELLAAYKYNAATCSLVNNEINIDQLDIKCLSNIDALIKKIHEQNARIWEVYQPASSGHLMANGTFKLPKIKQQALVDFDGKLPISELLTIGYNKQQIKCFCINEENINNIVVLIKEKQKLEKELELEELPLAIYSEKTGSLQVYFVDELIEDLEKLNKNILYLNDFSHSANFQPQQLYGIINTLPVDAKIKLLEDTQFKFNKEQLELTKKAIKIVSNPENYDIEKFRSLIAQGIDVNHQIFFQGEYLYYADILFRSENRRYINIKHHNAECYPQHEIEALDLFKELFLHGSSLVSESYYDYIYMIDYKQQILQLWLIFGISLKNLRTQLLFNAFQKPNNHEAILIINEKLQNADQNEKQLLLKDILILPAHRLQIPNGYYQMLMILFDLGADLLALKDHIIMSLRNFKDNSNLYKYYIKIYGNVSPEEIYESLVDFYENYKSQADYCNFATQLAISQQYIEQKKQMINFDLVETSAPKIKYDIVNDLKFLTDAFALPPVFDQIKNDDSTIVTILQHYYRRPGPERVVTSLYLDSIPTIWKQIHSSSHVLRAYNNVRWYIELLEQFDLACLSDDEKILLQLAIIYHDAAAEDVAKNLEEKQAAYYFKRDMQENFPTELLESISLALESKENDIHGVNEKDLDKKIRLYINILRFGDRMDFIRCAEINDGFTQWNKQDTVSYEFNPSLLNIPDVESIAFKRHLEAAMHGAADLAAISGGYYKDVRKQGSYATRYKLQINNQQLKTAFEYTNTPKSKLDELIDNNVRRKIASLAKINTCANVQHKTCKPDTTNGVMYGIHSSWLDLKQVQIPENMTLLEKMQCEHDITLLSKETLDAINKEVYRLQHEGIKMQLGSLTQKILKSPATEEALAARGLEIIKENRPRAYNKLGKQNFEEVLTVNSISKIK
jgi:hypothetical protein